MALIQRKSEYLPASALNPPYGSTVPGPFIAIAILPQRSRPAVAPRGIFSRRHDYDGALLLNSGASPRTPIECGGNRLRKLRLAERLYQK